MGVVSRVAAPLRPPSPRRLTRRRRRWPLLIPLAAIVAWGVTRLVDEPPATAAVPASSSAPAAPTSTILAFSAPVGERTTAARCWMVVIDESASMATADEPGTRADAVRAAGEFLAAYGVEGDRIGVTWFADRPAAEEPREAALAERAPRPPGGLGSGTVISAGLTAAFEAMDRTCGSTARVVVLVTDGQATSPGEFDATAAALTGRGRGAALHLIAMNGGGSFELARAFWEDAALGLASIRTIDTFGPDEVAAAVAAILSAETGQQVATR
jgi:von Willebrand factor type A domain